jgi:predicted Zn-dependent protease
MRRFLPLALVLLAACSDIVSPRRSNPYEYRAFVIKGTIDGSIDTVSFHWPRSYLPLRVWVDPADELSPHVGTAIARWQAAFLYGEVRAEMTDDSSHADIIVQNTVPPAGGAGVSLRVGARAPECRGETDLYYDLTAKTVILPIRMYVWPRFTTTPPGLEECYSLTVTHEFGHAIGLLGHSPDPSDVMYSDPVLDGISDRDRVTAETVYHINPTYSPTNRR